MGSSSIVFLVIGLFSIVAVVLALRSNIRASNKHTTAGAKKSRSSEKPTSSKRNPYRATAIVGSKNFCEAVREIADKRFLVSDKDIPPIPLPNCDAANCACTYAHFEDRRSTDGDRRGPVGLHSELHRYLGQVEQRIKRGRRVADWI
jgi:hypothetical protein